MQAKMCSRCGKNVAIVFITRVEGNEQKNEGLCLKCARELHIKPVDDMLEKMGISDEDLDSLSGDMMNALSGVESLMDIENGGGDDDSDDDGKTATFPFLN
ncbi:MAG: ATP-dependent Clp protease ATP-binding subunit, partial [Oscillospiraceae bacterium]|nr:ATP-dependent Clp protease ATP-binding subunit [Oscillospiraceae bacterium]